MPTQSAMVPLGTRAPDIRLRSFDGELVDLNDLEGSAAFLVMFLANHCPYARHVEKALGSLINEYQAKGLAALAVSSNDVEQDPEDGPDGMRAQAERAGFSFPYLYDEDQSVAKAFGAACTPDFFLFDRNRELVYRGQMDSSRPKSDEPATGEDLRRALDAVLAGEPPLSEQRPSMGCGIDWKPATESDQ